MVYFFCMAYYGRKKKLEPKNKSNYIIFRGKFSGFWLMGSFQINMNQDTWNSEYHQRIQNP